MVYGTSSFRDSGCAEKITDTRGDLDYEFMKTELAALEYALALTLEGEEFPWWRGVTCTSQDDETGMESMERHMLLETQD